MDKNMEIVAGLKLCVATGDDGCDACPYNNKGGPGVSCRQQLCMDAAKALADAANMAQEKEEELEVMVQENKRMHGKLREAAIKVAEFSAEQEVLKKELRDEIRKRDSRIGPNNKHTSVCSEVEGLKNDVQKLVEAVNFWRDKANYWQGIADGIKWGVHDRFKNTDNANDDAVEVPDDV